MALFGRLTREFINSEAAVFEMTYELTANEARAASNKHSWHVVSYCGHASFKFCRASGALCSNFLQIACFF